MQRTKSCPLYTRKRTYAVQLRCPIAALGEAAPQRKVTRLKEKSGFSSSLPRVKRLFRASFPPRGRQMPVACVFLSFLACKHRHSQLRRRWKQEKEKRDG